MNNLKFQKMTKNLIYLLSLIFAFSFVSCNKDNNEDDSDVSVNTLSAKWEISDSKSPYASFEFNKDGNYIVVENDVETSVKSLSTSLRTSFFKNNISQAVRTRSSEPESNLSPIHFGTYKIEGNKIILSGFGLIEVVSITAEEFCFSFTLESTGEKDSFVAGKSDEPISASSRTEMFCRTWILDKMTIDVNSFSQEDIDDFKNEYGDNWKNILEQELTEENKGICVLFSKAGTYLVLYDGEKGEAGLSEWKWANSQETRFYYSWDNWTEEDWSDNIVTIVDLKSTSLAVEEDGEIYYFKLK
jgi:hypothetical protein